MGSFRSEKYRELSCEEVNRRLKALEDMWKLFLEGQGEKDLEYHVHKQNILEVIKRQDQRMHYYNVFHDLKGPCEYKYIAIECFWINTLKPFMVTDENSSIYYCPNEMFSLYLIISVIRSVYELYKPNEKPFEYPSPDRIRDILYDFKYCSLSREAMIAFVETFADTYGIGIDFIQKNPDKIKKLLREKKISSIWGETD